MLVYSMKKVLIEYGDKLDVGEKEVIEVVLKLFEDVLKDMLVDKVVIDVKVEEFGKVL